MNDLVNKPEHYTFGKIECIQAMQAASSREEFLGYLRLSALKYIWRARTKDNTKQDIEKAIWYLNKFKAVLEEDEHIK